MGGQEPVQSKTQGSSESQFGSGLVTPQSVPDQIVPEKVLGEDHSDHGPVEQQLQSRGTEGDNLPEPMVPKEMPRGMVEVERRYPTRKRKPNVRLGDYVVEVDRVRAMTVRSYNDVLKGVGEEPSGGPRGREQKVMMLSVALEVVIEKLMAMVEDPGRREQ